MAIFKGNFRSGKELFKGLGSFGVGLIDRLIKTQAKVGAVAVVHACVWLVDLLMLIFTVGRQDMTRHDKTQHDTTQKERTKAEEIWLLVFAVGVAGKNETKRNKTKKASSRLFERTNA